MTMTAIWGIIFKWGIVLNLGVAEVVYLCMRLVNNPLPHALLFT